MTYLQFRKESLLGSTPSLQQFYKLQTEIQLHKNNGNQTIFGLEIPSNNDDLELVPGIKNEDLRDMFNTLSRGKGFIDIKTLYMIVKESKINRILSAINIFKFIKIIY